jgi:hypothetical protein
MELLRLKLCGRRSTQIMEIMMSTKRIYLTAFLSLFTAVSVFAEEQLLIVWAKSTDLYAGGKVQTSLTKGDIVRAVPKDREWLKVSFGETVLAARRRDFKSRPEVQRDYKLVVVDAENRLKGVKEQIESTENELKAVEEAKLMAARNGLSRFTVPGIHVTEFRIVDPASAVTYVQPRVVVEPDTIITHSWNDAKKVIKDLNEDREKLLARYRALRGKELEYQQRVAESESRSLYLDNRFSRFEINEDGYRTELYKAANTGALLYKDRKKVGGIPGGTLVSASPNSSHSGWLQVEYKGDVYDAQSDKFRSETELLERFDRDRLVLEHQLAAAEAGIEILRFREARLATLKREVQVAEELNGRLVSLTEKDLKCRLCTKKHTDCSHAAIEEIDQRDARRLLKEWDEDLGELRKDIGERRRAVGEIKKKQVTLDIAGNELDRKLRAAR